MIETNHMAKPVEKLQVEADCQVTEKILEEMIQIERTRVNMNIYGRRLLAFRIAKASGRLRNVMFDNGIEYCDWNSFIRKNTIRIENEKILKLKERVEQYREKFMNQDSGNDKNYFRDCYDRKRFLRPRNLMCFVCQGRGHRTKDCDYTYERVLERYRKDELEKKYKVRLGKGGGIERIKGYLVGKNFKYNVESRETLMNRFSDVFYNGEGIIEFCGIEKCPIKTKKGTKIVKKGAMIPQALLKIRKLILRA